MRPELLILPVLTFLATLLLYAAWGGVPVNRLGYALSISVVPAVLTWLITRWSNPAAPWHVVAVIYVALFLAAVVVQGLLRTVV
jgi:hypothetical protein